MVTKQLMRLDSLDERDVIRRILTDYQTQSGRCVSSWRDISGALRTTRLRIESTTGAPLDPSDSPYDLIKNGCDVDLSEESRVPRG